MGRISKTSKGYEQFDTGSVPYVQLNAYVSPTLRRQLRLAAARAGVSMSEYIKIAVVAKMESELGS